jgi:hypothetical protein
LKIIYVARAAVARGRGGKRRKGGGGRLGRVVTNPAPWDWDVSTPSATVLEVSAGSAYTEGRRRILGDCGANSLGV